MIRPKETEKDMVSAKYEKPHGLTRKKLKILNLKLFFHKVAISKEKRI
jgi:hypothetical protein